MGDRGGGADARGEGSAPVDLIGSADLIRQTRVLPLGANRD